VKLSSPVSIAGGEGTRLGASLQSAILAHDPNQSVEGKSISGLLSNAG